jgi:hypothetical protein
VTGDDGEARYRIARDARRAALVAAHGEPRMIDGGAALALLGLRGQVHPADVVAFAYRDRAAAAAWQASNAAHNGVPALGAAVAGDEVVGVLDLRPALGTAMDPALPDNAPPPRRRPGGGPPVAPGATP